MPGHPPKPNADHMSAEALGRECGVKAGTARKWCSTGRIWAEKRGTTWWIPRDEASIWIREYGRSGHARGRMLNPDVPGGSRAPYGVQRRTRATTDQAMKINLPPEILYVLDNRRRALTAKGIRATRTGLIREALILQYTRGNSELGRNLREKYLEKSQEKC